MRGGAPATRETDLLHPLYMVQEVHAVVLTGGRSVRGTWSKRAADEPTEYRDANGAAIELTPGRTWVELVPEGAAVDVKARTGSRERTPTLDAR